MTKVTLTCASCIFSIFHGNKTYESQTIFTDQVSILIYFISGNDYSDYSIDPFHYAVRYAVLQSQTFAGIDDWRCYFVNIVDRNNQVGLSRCMIDIDAVFSSELER